MSIVAVVWICSQLILGMTGSAGQKTRLEGHVLPVLQRATLIRPPGARAQSAALAGLEEAPLTVTVVLQRDDPAGFQRFLAELYDSRSPLFRKWISPREVSARFGPSPESYDLVASYLKRSGLTLVEGSANRLTLTARGTRAAAEQAFGVRIGDYALGDRVFYANDADPELPDEIAPHVLAVAGLTNLARPSPSTDLLEGIACGFWGNLIGVQSSNEKNLNQQYDDCITAVGQCVSTFGGTSNARTQGENWCTHFKPPKPTAIPSSSRVSLAAASTVAWNNVTGAGQKVGLLEFDTFAMSDVSNYIDLVGIPPTVIGNVSKVDVNGGAPAGANQNEVLLDIDNVLLLAQGAQVFVYDAPFTGAGTSFQTLLNRMINDGMTIISNSWSYCEDQTTASDAQSIDAILATAAASGISVFNASGDTGATCLDGSPNTVGVPADSPNATAVGGSSVLAGAAATYASETWWNGSSNVPPTGQGGFGVSKFFSKPSYQNALNPSSMRSVPDVVSNSDPARGVVICQASAGGCPSPQRYGGTSGAAPTWAAFTALLNEAQGQNLGNLNPLLYPLANTNAFHSAASLGSDFAHVGLGSPNVDLLHLALVPATPGAVSADQSSITLMNTVVSADGTSTSQAVVFLRDADGNSVAGKTVSLAKNGGSQAVITPASAVSSVANGAVIFTIKNTTIEDVTLTATDVTDGVPLTQTAVMSFVSPPATAGGIGANPPTVLADGVAASTITVTLQDSKGNGAVNKVVTLSQGNGRSSVAGPTPAVTGSNGQVTFSVTDIFTETVTYAATDVTDGNLPVPGSAQVSFTNGSGSNCNLGQEVPQSGWSISSPETGFALATNCVGVSGTAWDPAGNLWAMNYPNGKLYKFPPAGGTAGAGTLIGTLPDVTPPIGLPTCPHGLTFSKDGLHLYVARQFCGSGGDVVELNMTDASILRTVATGIPCATGISTDPLSGDLFVSTPCPPGGGTENIYRIANPESATPVVSIYSSPGHALGMNFTSDGTLWTQAFPFVTPPCSFPGGTVTANVRYIVKIAGTNAQNAGACTYLSTALPNVEGILPALNPANPGSPPFLLASGANVNVGISKLDLTQNPPAVSNVATGGAHTLFINAGPDGCAYVSNGDRVDRITAADGSCSFAPSAPGPVLALSPSSVSPNPAQGTSRTFTATIVNAAAPANTPVFFAIEGANSLVQEGRTDAGGKASVSYTGVFAGTDKITATVTVGGSTLKSNTARVTWGTGKHTTFLSFGSFPTSGTAGTPVTLGSSLVDVSQNPPVAIAGASILFSLGTQSCTGTTGGNGLASCSLTPLSGGTFTLSASYAGSAANLPAAATSSFFVLGPGVSQTPTPTSTPTSSPTPTPTSTAAASPTPTRTATPPSLNTPIPMLQGWPFALLALLLAGLGILVARRAM